MIKPEKEYDFDPRNLPPDALAAIGLAVTSSAQTESVIENAIAVCLGLDFEYGLAVTTHMSAPLRDNVLRAAAEIRINNLDALDTLDKILDHIKNEAIPKRNNIVHRTWGVDPETGEIFTVRQTARGRVEMELVKMPVDKIKSDALVIYEAGMALVRFLAEHQLFPTYPSHPRPRWHKSKAARKKRRKK